ncbi:MAG TPA: hypothetical protein VKG24_23185 [Pseudolabrys sp.]|nr:hypothetical protein [Pseudolabrys sp.]
MKMVRRQSLHLASAATALFASPCAVRSQPQASKMGVTPPLSARGSGMHPEAKFHTAVRWLHEQARARKLREEEIRRYVWWTLSAAVVGNVLAESGFGWA